MIKYYIPECESVGDAKVVREENSDHPFQVN